MIQLDNIILYLSPWSVSMWEFSASWESPKLVTTIPFTWQLHCTLRNLVQSPSLRFNNCISLPHFHRNAYKLQLLLKLSSWSPMSAQCHMGFDKTHKNKHIGSKIIQEINQFLGRSKTFIKASQGCVSYYAFLMITNIVWNMANMTMLPCTSQSLSKAVLTC